MSQETVVTHLIGGGTSGTFRVGLATAQANGTIIDVLGSVDIVGPGADQEVALATPITLMPGTMYALGSGGDGVGSFYVMQSIDVTALEAHPRIQSGTWMPDDGSAYEWGSGLTGFSGGASPTTTLPRIGFRYQQ